MQKVKGCVALAGMCLILSVVTACTSRAYKFPISGSSSTITVACVPTGMARWRTSVHLNVGMKRIELATEEGDAYDITCFAAVATKRNKSRVVYIVKPVFSQPMMGVYDSDARASGALGVEDREALRVEISRQYYDFLAPSTTRKGDALEWAKSGECWAAFQRKYGVRTSAP